MNNEVKKYDENALALLNESQLSQAIKPLNTEIHLFDTFISGTMQLKDQAVLDRLQVGDRLVLRRSETLFDANTIEIYSADNLKLGYVPEKDNAVFARLMDAGKCLIAKVAQISKKPSMSVITIGIYLIDF
jgi:hypothetical protein